MHDICHAFALAISRFSLPTNTELSTEVVWPRHSVQCSRAKICTFELSVPEIR